MSGPTRRLADNFSAGYGFDGIVVALLARNSPIGAVPAAFAFAAIRQGGGSLEGRAGVPVELVMITEGLLIFALAGAAVLLGRLETRRVDVSARTAAVVEGVH